MDEAAAEEKQKQILERAEAVDGLAFAIGTHVVRGGESVRAAMRAADEEMYANKREYYARHPELKAR